MLECHAFCEADEADEDDNRANVSNLYIGHSGESLRNPDSELERTDKDLWARLSSRMQSKISAFQAYCSVNG